MDSQQLASIGEVARVLGVSVSQVRKLTNEGRLTATTTPGGHRRYDLASVVEQSSAGSSTAEPPVFDRVYALDGVREDEVWKELRSALEPHLGTDARKILSYAVTEMVNNAIDHSGGREVRITGAVADEVVSVTVEDDGVGVFDRLVDRLRLPDRFAAIQELSKGKATTAPERHSGEGIFFTSKGVDRFRLAANGLVWIVDNLLPDTSVAASPRTRGTQVGLELHANTGRSMKEVFDQFTINEAFVRTRPAIKLLEYGTEFVSRSEAKRLAERLDQFTEVELDFAGVTFVGQGFVDELFRVWAREHPRTLLIPINMNDEVGFMVRRGLGGVPAS